MGRIVVVILVAAAAAWYYFVGGRKIDEGHVRAAYAAYWSAFDANDGKATCDLYDKRFTGSVRMPGPGAPVDSPLSRDEACAGTARFHEMKDALAQKSGTEMHFTVEYTLVSVEIAGDGKSATARMDSEIRVGTELRPYLTIRESQTDTLVRSLGSVRFLKSDGTVSMR